MHNFLAFCYDTDMIIHYICRGNAFRSIIAEAYTNSLQLSGVTVRSSGTVASEWKERNARNVPKTLAMLERHGIRQFAKDHYADDIRQEWIDEADVVVCLNQRVYDEAQARCTLPADTRVWDVTDTGEKDRIVKTEDDLLRYIELAYNEIRYNVDALVAELGR